MSASAIACPCLPAPSDGIYHNAHGRPVAIVRGLRCSFVAPAREPCAWTHWSRRMCDHSKRRCAASGWESLSERSRTLAEAGAQ